MKRFYNYFLSLFLLSLVGITGALAQGFSQGSLVTSIDDITADQSVLIYAPGGVTSDAPAGYLNGTNQFTSTLTDECLYNIIPTGETTASGYKTYYLKQVATGLYVKDLDLDAANDDEAEFAMTADISEAYKCTVLEANDITSGEAGTDEASRRTDATSAKQDLSETAFVFARHDFTGLGEDWNNKAFIGHVYSPFWSMYEDTNAFRIYTITNLTGIELLQSYCDAYYASGDPEQVYTAGTTPGAYEAEAVAAAKTVYDKAQAALANGSISDAEAEALCKEIESSVAAVKAAKIPLTAGYYYIKAASGRYIYENTVDGTEWVYATGDTYEIPEELTAADANYIWKVTGTIDSLNLVNIQSAVTGNAMGEGVAACSGTDDGYGVSLTTSDAKVVAEATSCNGDNALYALILQVTSPGNSHKGMHAKYANGHVMTWNNPTGIYNAYKFIPANIDDAKLAELIAQAKQNALNAALKAAYDTAKEAYDNGFETQDTYTTAVQKDADFATEGALVSAGADEDNANWWSNAKSSAEGTYLGLTDDNVSTYFHSDYGATFTPSLEEGGTCHYLVATLANPIEGGFVAKLAKRFGTGNDYPTQFTIFASNDFDKTNPDAATWTIQGVRDINWDTNVTYEGTEKENHIALISCPLDGAYQYIKFAATKTEFNASDPRHNRGYFALGEMNIWPTTDFKSEVVITPEMKEVMASAEQVVKNLTDLLNKSAEIIEAGNATQADIDAMQAAYDEFMSNYPDPSRVTTAYNKAKTFLDNATNNDLVGDELAQYSSEKGAALQTVLETYAEFSDVSLSAINAAVNAIENALAEFKASVNLPEAGKFYYIRSASKKLAGTNEGFTGTQYTSLVYSNVAATAAGNVKFFKPNHGSEVTSENPDYTVLNDSVTAAEDLRLVWKAESAADGKIVLRNVGTGMYLDASEGSIKQSISPVNILVEGIQKATFRFNAGEDANGTVQYMNAQGSTNTVVVWKDATDLNSNWTIEEVEEGDMDLFVRFNNVKAEQLAPYTLSVDVDPSNGDVNSAYSVVGMSTDDEGNKLVLAEIQDVIPAGTPFIASFMSTSSDGSTVGNAQLAIAADDVNSITYGFEAKTVNGLTGVLVKNDTIATGMQYFTGGAVKSVADKSTVTIGVSSAYLNGQVPATEEEGDETIDLGKVDVTSINNAKVVVLPSTVNVYSINGTLLRKAVKSTNAAKGLPAGVYVIGGHKVIVK